jgi:hypothetical protein
MPTDVPGGSLQHVADAALGVDERGLDGVDLAAQIGDV